MTKRPTDPETPLPLETELDEIALAPTGMPVRAMERVLALGETAVPAIADALEFWDDDREADPLWLIVLLGEIGSPLAVPALIRQLQATDADLLVQAAAESLAKVGAAAVPALREVVAAGDAQLRLYAYAALGWIDSDDSYSVLAHALEHDRELADVVGTAMLQHARRVPVDALLAAYRACEPWQRPELEDAIRAAHDRTPDDAAWRRDWRLRYRRRPDHDGAFDLEWPGIAAILRQDESVRADRASSPLRSLDEILGAPRPVIAPEPELCDDCGQPIERPMAVPMCPSTAVAVALDQLAVLSEARDDGIEDLFELLDELEEEEFLVQDEPEPRKARAREEREEILADFAEARATCEWLIEQGVEDVGGGKAVIAAHVAELAARHGDPDGLLAPVAPMRTRAPKIGRNDPCPCGSGRKYKRCCLESDAGATP